MERLCSCHAHLPKRPLYDARGIFCAYVCDACEQEEREKFRSDIFNDRNHITSTEAIKMTRKDFEFIAATLAEVKPFPEMGPERTAQWADTCRQFMVKLALANPQFNAARFLAACGVRG